MNINIGQNNPQKGMQSRSGKIPQGATVISNQLIKKSVMIDRDGNQIDPITKQIIKRNNTEK